MVEVGVVGRDRAQVLGAVELPLGVVGVAVDVAMEATDPDGDPMTFSADGLPDGLGMAADTGLITGVPSLAGTFPVTVTVSDGITTDSQSFTITVSVAEVAPQITSSPVNTATVGQSYSYGVVATGTPVDRKRVV